VGAETAEIYANNFTNIDDLANAKTEDLQKIESIGPIIAASTTEFFKQSENQAIIDKLKSAKVFHYYQYAKNPVSPSGSPLSGKEFVLTGRLDSLSRPEAEARIKALGGVAKDNVTRKTDYVVYGADPGSKLARARELGIKAIEEKEFLKLIGKG
ncbi:MAG: helix-hairpin-helix domain-containing protein, partial [Dehalococcoidales bacterium]